MEAEGHAEEVLGVDLVVVVVDYDPLEAVLEKGLAEGAVGQEQLEDVEEQLVDREVSYIAV